MFFITSRSSQIPRSEGNSFTIVSSNAYRSF